MMYSKRIFFTLFLCLGLLSSLSAQSWFEKGRETDDNLLKVEYFTNALEKEKKDNWTYYFRGFAYNSLRRYNKALTDYKAALEAPGNLDLSYVYSSMAWTHYSLSDYKTARKYASKSREKNPRNPDSWNVSGWIEIVDSEAAKALSYFDKYVQLRSDNYFAYANRSYAYMLNKRYQEAITDCDKGLSLNPEYKVFTERKALALMKLGKKDQGIALLKDQIDFKNDDPLSLSNIGDLYYSAEDYETAIEYHTAGIELYNEKIKEDPKFIKVYQEDVYNIYLDRGQAYQALEKHFEALADYKKATSIKENDHRAWQEIGELQTTKKNWLEAIHAYERSFEITPDYDDGWVNLGFCYDHLKQPRKAINAYTRGIAIDPSQGLLWNNRGYAYLIGKQYDKALSDLNKAIEVDPGIVMSHVSLAEYYHFKGDYDQAISKFNECLNMDNGSNSAYFTAYYTRGLAYAAQEKWELAEADQKDALLLDKNHGLAWEALGIAHFNQKEECEAYRAFKKAMAADANKRPHEVKEAGLYLARLTRNPCKD